MSPTAEKREKENRRKPAAVRIIGKLLRDIVLAGMFLCVFAVFHHVIPRINAKNTVVPAATVIVAPTPVPSPEITEPVETEEPEEPDYRTEWQKKFEEHFTDEIVVTENSYSSPNVSINIDTRVMQVNGIDVVYHVADIYVGSIENFQTYLAGGNFEELEYYRSDSPVKISEDAGAIVAINGDYCNNQYSGILVRNGVLFMTAQTECDICVLYYDGTMETYTPDEYISEEILSNEPYQIWKFGPELLDEYGQPCTDFNTGYAIKWENPRSGLGYFEPGHYCFIVVDGRQNGYSRGIEIEGFAQMFADLGCVRAYNMDGGASAIMTFNGEEYSRKSNGGRDIGDILLIRETDAFLNSVSADAAETEEGEQ